MAKIYVGTYEKYNNGSTFGDWLDADAYSDKEEFIEACKELHKDESNPEFRFQDYGGFPNAFYHESSIDSRLWDWLEFDEDERNIVEAWLSESTIDNQKDLQSIVESFAEAVDSWEEYAEEITNERGGIPKHLVDYIDYEKMGRDLMDKFSGYVEYEGKIWLFC